MLLVVVVGALVLVETNYCALVIVQWALGERNLENQIYELTCFENSQKNYRKNYIGKPNNRKR